MISAKHPAGGGLVALLALGLLVTSVGTQESWYLYYRQGVAAIEAGQWKDALAHLDKALELRKEPALHMLTDEGTSINYLPYFQRGLAYLGLKDYARALESFKISESYGAIKSVKADYNLLKQLKKLAEAEVKNAPVPQEPEKKLAKETQSPVLDLAMSKREVASRTTEETLKAEKPVQPSAPSPSNREVEIYGGLIRGKALMNKGKYEDAYSELQDVLTLDPNNAEAKSLLAQVQTKLSDRTGEQNVDSKREQTPPRPDRREAQQNIPEPVASVAQAQPSVITETSPTKTPVEKNMASTSARPEPTSRSNSLRRVPAFFEKKEDTLEPTVTILSPQRSEHLSHKEVTLTGKVEAPRGIRSVELLINGGVPDTLFAATDDEIVKRLTVERRMSLREGKNWMLLRAHDKAGVSKDRAQFFVVDVPFYRSAVFAMTVGIGSAAVLTLLAYTFFRWRKRMERLKATIEERTRELKTLQARLAERERKKSVEEILEDLVKEINEPISSIHRNHDILSRSFKKIKSILQNPDDFLVVCENGQLLRLIEALETLNEENQAACNTSIRVVDNLRNLTVVQDGQGQRANVHDAVENALAMLQQGEEKRVEVLRDYGPIPDILFEPIQLNLVFMNVLANAFQEVGPRGPIHIKTFEDDDNVVVKIRYSTANMVTERGNRVSGATTRIPSADGPRLGLATVHKIMQDHQGKIFLEHRDRNIKEFILILPTRKEKIARLTEFEWS